MTKTIYYLTLILQFVASAVIALLIIYGTTLPYPALGINLAMAVFVLLLCAYFLVKLRAFKNINISNKNLSKYLLIDLFLQIFIMLVLIGAVTGAASRVFSEGFAVFG